MAGAGQEEAADRQDDRRPWSPRAIRLTGGYSTPLGAVPHPFDPALGVARVGDEPVVAVEVSRARRSGPTSTGHGPGHARRATRRRRAPRSPARRGGGCRRRCRASAGTQDGQRRSTRTGSPGGTSTLKRSATLRRRSTRDAGASTVARPTVDAVDLGRSPRRARPPPAGTGRAARSPGPAPPAWHGDHQLGVAAGPADAVQPGRLGRVEPLAPARRSRRRRPGRRRARPAIQRRACSARSGPRAGEVDDEQPVAGPVRRPSSGRRR